MRFLLDENVPRAVADVLRQSGHDVALAADVLAAGSPDQLVATAAEQDNRILVSHDRDMRRIERANSEGARARYEHLSRLFLCCAEPSSAERVRMFMAIIEAEFLRVQDHDDRRMFLEIGDRRVRIFR